MIGNGLRSSFWINIWCDDMDLTEKFANLFNVARDRRAKVADYWRNEA